MSPFTKPILMASVVAAMTTPGGALAQPAHHVATSANTAHRQHRPSASHSSITFTNPLGRSRGPGAGMGLL